MSELSPAAQAVRFAAFRVYDEEEHLYVVPAEKHAGMIAAAALRAAAELLSKEVDAPKVDGSKYNGLWHSFDYLNAIADELETK